MKKEAFGSPDNPRYVAEEIAKLIKIMISKMSVEGQRKTLPNIREKIDELNPIDMSNKKQPGGASIGVSISLIKNILNSKDPYYINVVLNELKKQLV